MDIAIDPRVLQKRQLLSGGRYVLALFAVVAAVMSLWSLVAPSVSRSEIRTAIVERGAVSTEVVAVGTVVPQREHVLSSPLTSSIREVLLPLGTSVKQGDAILQLDSAQVDSEILRLTDELQLKELEAERIEQQQHQTLRDLRNQQQLASIDYENQKVVLERFSMLFERNIVSKLDYDANKLALQKAELMLRQVEQRISDTLAADQNQLQQNEVSLRLLKQRLQDQQQLKDHLTIRAQSDGIITVLADEVGRNVNAGMELARVSNLSSFRVDATVSDFYLSQIAAGMPVNVDLGEATLSGKLDRILPAVENGTVLLQIAFDHPDNAGLKQNLRVEARIVTASRSEGLRVSNGVAFKGAGLQEVFVINGDEAIKRQVSVGLSNSKYVEITSGPREGDEIIISDMADYQQLEQVDIDN